MEFDARAAQRHCRSQMPPKKKARKRPREEEKTESALASSVLSAVTCPISHSLAVQPVLAEDGQCYEREEIRKWLEKKIRLRSPTSAWGLDLSTTSRAGIWPRP